MLTMEKTADYVKRWVAAFESKDLDRVLAFYSEDVIFHSPLVARLSHDPSGTVQGKAALEHFLVNRNHLHTGRQIRAEDVMCLIVRWA